MARVRRLPQNRLPASIIAGNAAGIRLSVRPQALGAARSGDGAIELHLDRIGCRDGEALQAVDAGTLIPRIRAEGLQMASADKAPAVARRVADVLMLGLTGFLLTLFGGPMWSVFVAWHQGLDNILNALTVIGR